MKWSKLALLFIATLSCLFALSPAFSIIDDDGNDNTGSDDTQVYSIADDVDMVSTLTYQYAKPKIVVQSTYPQLESDTENGIGPFNQLVKKQVQEAINEFKNQVAQTQSFQKTLPKSALKNNLYIDYDTSVIKSDDVHVISIRLSVQGSITGMAHPYHYHRVLNYALEDAQELSLNDLFVPDADYLSVLSDYTSQVLSRRLSDKDMVLKGTAPSPENFMNWNIKPNGLLITFDEAQVAPYVAGAQTVLVPYGAFKHMIAPDSFIAGCINHKKRCSQNNVLTGGFIDEANNSSITKRINTQHRILNPSLSKL